MSWVKDMCRSFFQLLCIKLVKVVRVPQHIAFIMDGNRRFAKKNSVNISDGHSKGKEKLSETLKWCLDLGIPEVTAYAFSIENFTRTQDEVDSLMDLFRVKLQRFLSDLDILNKCGIRVHIAGRLSLLPDDVKALAAKTMLATRHNDKLRFNIAYAYTGRDEISRAASQLVTAVRNKQLAVDDIDEALVTQTLELREAQLLVRTSGEVRLSDFMLWQVSKTVLYFSDVLWPEFSIWNFIAAIIHFHRYAPHATEEAPLSEQKQQFLKNLESQRWMDLEKIVNCSMKMT